MKKTCCSLFLVGLLTFGKTFAVSNCEIFEGRGKRIASLFVCTAAVGFASNVFVSKPKTILIANTCGVAGLAWFAGALRVLGGEKFALELAADLSKHELTKTEMAFTAVTGFGVGAAAGRLVNMTVRGIYNKIKGQASPQQKD